MAKIKELLNGLWVFTVRERRAILWFIPVIIVVSLVVASLSRPRFEQSLHAAAGEPGQPFAAPHPEPAAAATPSLFRFDPNTIDYRGLRKLGFTARAASGILRYRASGKIFRIREDFAACRDVGDSVFYALEPYIIIGAQFAVGKSAAAVPAARPGASAAPVRESPAPFDPNALDAEGFRKLGFSIRQAEAIVKRREQTGGFRSAAEFAECYVVSDEMFARLGPYIRIAAPAVEPAARIELNAADSAGLVAVRGIGALTAGRIVAYRARLGGFARAGQLAEVQGMTEQNYERILQQISVDSSVIQKIDINFALPEKLAGHPYIPSAVLRKIVKNRQLKGGWSTPESMIEDGTLTEAQAARLAPYLKFTPILNR